MQTLTCIIIDDEPLARALLENYVEKTPFLHLIGSYPNAIEAMAVLRTSQPHIAFLDIQMPELNGMELAKLMPPSTKVIFTTAFDQYAIDGYKVNAFGYLLKPIAYPDFLEVANSVLKALTPVHTGDTIDSADDQCFFVKSDYRIVRIEYNDILYVEGLKDYVKIYCTSSPRPILSLLSMKSIEERLPAERFLRTHRSYVVNMQRITAIEKSNILIDEKSIPISDAYRDRILEYVNQRLINQKN